ncbi:elongation factor Ts, mitochondrial [Antennarius striatus]|uniref:elongation factor Ts, mitochondrial n=1 Tax=Antennarius striatus TaxID=241820 RepID=UPI0035B16657
MSLNFFFRTVTKASFGQHARSIHTGYQVLVAEKANIMKLRKSTGYTFINCKNALEKFDNDITQAETWLHEQAQKEGWTKATKLGNRKAKQGLIGLFMEDKEAVMVEVNCETDFVARNETFQQLVKDVIFASLAHHRNKSQSRTGYVKSVLVGEELSKLCVAEGTSLADRVAFTIGRLGENLSLTRAVTFGVPAEWKIGSYVHGSVSSQNDVPMGQYGALVVFEGGKEEEQPIIGSKLGQHIVGDAPLSLGNMDDVPCGESETRLLPQTFLADSSKTVAEFLQEQQARVLDFVRFQCGETTDEDNK